MFVTYERGKILSKLFVACFICTRIAAKFHEEKGASNHMTDFPSSKNLRYKKDSSEPHSSDFQRILPVQVDFGSLVNTINHRILGMEGNVTNLDKQLRIIEQIEAKMQQEALQLRQQLKSCKESKARVDEAKAEVEEAKARVEEAKAEVEETNLRLKENCTREQDSLKKENSQLREQLKSLEGNNSRKCTKGDKTFLFVNERPREWQLARLACKKKGGDLAMHLTKEDLRKVHEKWIQPLPNDYWIGGSIIKTGADVTRWRWVDGDEITEKEPWQKRYEVNYRKKVPKLRDGHCIAVYSDPNSPRTDGTKGPTYLAEYCSRYKAFLCEIY